MAVASAAPLHAPRLVVGIPAGQLQEIGAVMAATVAANLGWHPVYLGPNLRPMNSLARF